MWKLNFKIEQAATVATPATKTPIPDNKPESVATVAIVAGGDVLQKSHYPPIPKSVNAALVYLKRTKFEKPLTPKLEAWLESDRSIESYERTVERINQGHDQQGFIR